MAAIRTESFYLGVNLRAGIWRLDGRLLRFQLSNDQNEREDFLRESRELSERIEHMKPHLVSAREIELLTELEPIFEAYLADATPLLERGIRGIRRDTTEQLARDISNKSAPVLQLCDRLAQAQNEAWRTVLAQSDHSISNVIRLMQTSALLMLVLCAGILVLAYRVFITPLRSRLDESAAQLQRQEKLASLGSLATGVAHEIRNPLAAIKFRLFSLKESLASGAADTEDLQIIGDEINRLERIVRDFLRFARPSEPELAKVSAAELLREVHDLLRGQFEKQSVQFSIEPADDLWLRADKEQIKQVLINLAQNAAESLQANGRVTLCAKAGAARLANASEPVVVLEVADNGAGIPPVVEARLFDPFFSTKKGGTGLGLSIAARIVEKHGGHIQYQTQRNRGTTFGVVLPRWTNDVTTNPAD
jgi:signal transduction histidine kinase